MLYGNFLSNSQKSAFYTDLFVPMTASPPPKKLLDVVRDAIRLKHYSYHTLANLHRLDRAVLALPQLASPERAGACQRFKPSSLILRLKVKLPQGKIKPRSPYCSSIEKSNRIELGNQLRRLSPIQAIATKTAPPQARSIENAIAAIALCVPSAPAQTAPTVRGRSSVENESSQRLSS